VGTRPEEYRLSSVDEVHERGSILVAAVFDAYFTVYVRRTADLIRLARAGRGISPAGDLHPELAARLAREAAKTARHFLTICVRALDYLPPVDVTFGDYLRAILTSDHDIVPDDMWQYRAAIIEAFRSRGIRAEGVGGTSEASLRWSAAPPDLRVHDGDDRPFEGTAEEVEKRLRDFAAARAAELGLVDDVPVTEVTFELQDTRRVDPSIGLRQREFVAQFVQIRPEGVPAGPLADLGGTTVLFWGDGQVRYIISRPLPPVDADAHPQQEFAHHLAMRAPAAPFEDEGELPVLARLHRGW
jgi:hypothetical protein